MSDSPDEIRADIERTRRELGGDVDALADKVSPSKMMERQTDKLKGAVTSVRERVMGAADEIGDSVAEAGSSASDHLGEMKDRVVAKAEGNPLAVGLIAFGAGLLVASLIPASRKEKEIAGSLKDQAQPLVDEVTSAAEEVGAHLKEPAMDAVASVKEAAKDSVETVKDQAQDAAAEVKGQADQARANIGEH